MLLQELESVELDCVLVLDDYHAVTAPPVHQILAYLLDHLPPAVHLLISTRVDPPVPLARWRARGDLLELRAADLRFSPAEAAAFLSESMGLDLEPGDLEKLETRTEGWIAGLQMAALAMKGKHDIHGFIQAFSGSHRFILDYLAEEVITRQPEDVQAFLLQTSHLERFCAGLCQEVTGAGSSGEAQEFIERLERSNLFLIALDDERRWFRYHHLFAELLRARLQQTRATQVPLLHLRAARWFERNAFLSEAVQHALAANEVELAADWIERYWQQRWAASDQAFLLLVGRLPEEYLRRRPMLGIYQAWMWIIYGQVQRARPLLGDLAQNLAGETLTPETPGLRGFIDLLQVYCADLSGEASLAGLPDPRVLENVPPYLLAMRNSADVVLAILLSARGEYRLVEEILFKTMRRDIAANGTTAVPISAALIARNRIIQGRLREAVNLCQDYLRQVDARGAWQYYLAGNLNLVIGDVLREWNRLGEAEEQIREGTARNAAWNIPLSLSSSAAATARLQRARGNPQAGLEAIQQAERLLAGRLLPLDALNDLNLERVRLRLDLADLSSAAAWADSFSTDGPLDCRTEPTRITLARIRLAQGLFAEAHTLLEDLAVSAQSSGRFGRLAVILLLDAQALWALGDRGAALDRMEACLKLAAPEGWQRLFLDGGEAVREILKAYDRDARPVRTRLRAPLAGDLWQPGARPCPGSTRPGRTALGARDRGAAPGLRGLRQ